MTTSAFILLSYLSNAMGDETPKGVMRFPISKQVPLQEHVANLAKRSDNVAIDLSNELNMFTTILELGSDKQKVDVLVDTGSSDLWVMSPSNSYCSSISDSKSTSNLSDDDGKIGCSTNAMFNTSTSSSWSKNDTDFSVTYGDFTFANGTYGQDTVGYGGVSIEKGSFAVAEHANSTNAVWGIGLIGLESIVTTIEPDGSLSPTYSNLPLQMKEQGIIGHNAYSLWLNDIDSDEGELLFGGVDHSKYSGTLQTVPLISSYSGGVEPSAMQVMLNGISVYQGSSIQEVASFSLPALLDSGTTLMLMPASFLESISKSIGAQFSSNGYVGPCDLSGGLVFDFSGAEIFVPFKQLTFNTGGDTCVLGFSPSGSSQIILGDTFLRSAYVVYDLENHEISLANTEFNVSSSSVEAISSSVPKATKAKRYSSTQIGSSFSTTTATGFQTGYVSDSIETSSFPSGTPSSAGQKSGIPSSSSDSESTSGSNNERNENGASNTNYLSVMTSSLSAFIAVTAALMLA